MTDSQRSFHDGSEGLSGRYLVFFWIMIVLFIVLLARLWMLQIIKGEDYRSSVESNRTEQVELAPVRGLITDRNGTVLVDNRARFDLYVEKYKISDPDRLIKILATISSNWSEEDLLKKYENLPKQKFAPVPFIYGLSREELVAIETRRHLLDGVSIQVAAGRRPIFEGVFASHIIGYLGEISKKRLDVEKKDLEDRIIKYVEQGYSDIEAALRADIEVKPHRPGDWVGQSGIEQSAEKYLQGRRGSLVREVDSKGRVLNVISTVNPEPGYNVLLTIDTRLQGVAQSLLGESAGAIVVMNPNNFEILAMASSPTFDLEDFVGGVSPKRWKELRQDPFHPMQNKAVAGVYPPGSTFKIVTAMAALAEGVITPETIFHCPGSLKLGNHTFGCHNRAGHGPVNLRRSLMVSCDVYYYEVGRRLGVDRLAKRAKEFFGLGQKLGVDLFDELGGLIPDSQWKQRVKGKRWMQGETLPVSIGQGYVLTSPLQVAQFTSVLANGGHLYRPHLIKEITDVNGQLIKRFEPEHISSIDLDPKYIKAVQEGLDDVVNAPGGTGRRAALQNVRVAGKTGTSQVVSLKRYQGYAKNKLPYKYRDHAWFTSYAPIERPEVVVTVLLEHTGGGGRFAAPVAQQMLEAYFDKHIMASTLPSAQVRPDQPLGWSPQ